MLIPRRVKHRKQHHPKRRGQAKGGTQVSFGEYGIQAHTPAYVTNRQIEAARIANEKIAREALTRAAHKLPMKCRIVKREAGEA